MKEVLKELKENCFIRSCDSCPLNGNDHDDEKKCEVDRVLGRWNSVTKIDDIENLLVGLNKMITEGRPEELDVPF